MSRGQVASALVVSFVVGFAAATLLHGPKLLRSWRELQRMRDAKRELEAGVTPIEIALSKRPRRRRR